MKREAAARTLALIAPDLLSYFRRRVPDVEDAADLVSETFVAAWKSIARMPECNEEARMWLFGVAQNMLRRHHRSARRRDALTSRLASVLEPHPWADDGEGIDIRNAVATLPPELAELVRLVHWDGFTLEQVAVLTKAPASTVRTRHARAKELLRTALAPSSKTAAHAAGRTS